MKKNLPWLVLALLFSLSACKKESTDETGDPEALPANEVAILDALPEATGFNSSTVVLPNGEKLKDYLKDLDSVFNNQWMRGGNDAYNNLGPQDARNLLIKRITMIALNLTDRSRYQKPDEGPGKPAQNGLAYSWGSKNYAVRQNPPGSGTVCTEKIYGLDCSGFIHQLFTNAGVPFLVGPANSQRQPAVLQEAIKSAIPALKKVKVESLGAIATSKFESGDIVYWTNAQGVATHIGIVLKDQAGRLAVFQSNGSVGNDPNDCLKNMGIKRGARRLELNDPYWFGPNKVYGITRINAEISGKWEFKFRCAGNNPVFATINLDFPSGSDASFTISKSYLDLDGSTNPVTFNFKYDKTTNELSCDYITTDSFIPGFERKDHFAVKLTKDLINYFPSQQVYVHNGFGCIYEVMLKNLN